MLNGFRHVSKFSVSVHYSLLNQPTLQKQCTVLNSTQETLFKSNANNEEVVKPPVHVSTNNKKHKLDFQNFQTAFKPKTTMEIIKALFVYKLCSVELLVNKNKELINISRRVFGKRIFDFLMQNSFYGHFVAGEAQEDIKEKLDLMRKYGVNAILDYAVEADIPQSEPNSPIIEHKEQIDDEGVHQPLTDLADVEHRFQRHNDFRDRRQRVVSARTYFYEGEENCDANMQVFLDCIDTTGATSTNGFAAIKVTALGRPTMLLRLSQILNQTRFYFDQLASTEGILTQRNIAKEHFMAGLTKLGVSITEDGANRIFKVIDTNKSGGIDVIEWHNFLTPQLQLSKLFRAAPEKYGEIGEEVFDCLNSAEIKEIENMQHRLLTIVERAREKKVRLMVDAEQTYFQPAITHMTLEAMREYNKEDAIIYNTYQCYLKDTMKSIEIDMELARREKFCFGAKLVRGAYMEQERLRAHTVGYPDPVHPTYEATSECYNEVLETVIEEVCENRASLMIASHNEQSIRHAIDTMSRFRIEPNDNKVFFGQLLGMCDVITYALGGAGYAAYKYVPYGPIEDVMPYLSRRAMENRSLMKGVQKERRMLWAELMGRFKGGRLNHDPNAL